MGGKKREKRKGITGVKREIYYYRGLRETFFVLSVYKGYQKTRKKGPTQDLESIYLEI